MKSALLVSGITLGVLLAGYASSPVALSSAENNHQATAQKNSEGYLQVFSAREKSNEIGENTFFYPHSGYRINDANGKTIRYVQNHLSDMDESPDQVKLPAGSYQIVARSTWAGQVSVPVVVESGNTTVLRLDVYSANPSATIARSVNAENH